MKDLPLISVIVPVYKAEEYLDKCFESIVNQTYTNLEIFLVDDGSPGSSGAICDRWAQKDARITVIHKKNGGTGQARNVAMDAAKGSFIAFLDCDDYIAPDMYAHLYEIMDDETDIAECAFLETYDDEAKFDTGTPHVTYFTPVEAMREHIQNTVFRQIVWNKLYRREVLEGVRFLDGIKLDDEFFTYRVLGRARKLVLTDKKCHAYRQQMNSVIHQKYSVERVQGIRARKLRLDYLKEHMPSLVYEAQVDLLLSCLYAAQGSLNCLSGTELEEARELIQETMAQITPVPIARELSLKRKVLLFCAQRTLEGTAKVLNFLIDIHILT